MAKIGHAPQPKTLAEAQSIIDRQHRYLQKHPAARANRIAHLVLFIVGGIALVAAATGLSFRDGGNTMIQVLVGILLVAPETIGVAGATEAAKSFAASLGGTLGKARKKGDGA